MWIVHITQIRHIGYSWFHTHSHKCCFKLLHTLYGYIYNVYTASKILLTDTLTRKKSITGHQKGINLPIFYWNNQEFQVFRIELRTYAKFWQWIGRKRCQINNNCCKVFCETDCCNVCVIPEKQRIFLFMRFCEAPLNGVTKRSSIIGELKKLLQIHFVFAGNILQPKKDYFIWFFFIYKVGIFFFSSNVVFFCKKKQKNVNWE